MHPRTLRSADRLSYGIVLLIGLVAACSSAAKANGGADSDPNPPVQTADGAVLEESPYGRALEIVRGMEADREASDLRANAESSLADSLLPPPPAPGSDLAPQVRAAPDRDAPRPWFDTVPTWTKDARGWTRDGSVTYLTEGVDVSVLSERGATVEGLYIVGEVRVAADDVTFRNCLFDGAFAVYYATNTSRLEVTGTRFVDCEFVRYRSAAVFGGNVTLERCHIHEMWGDALKPTENVLVQDCFIHGLGLADGAHADGAQLVGGGPVTFRRCNFWMPWPGAADAPSGEYKSNATLFICTNNAQIRDVLIEGCWLNGGNYAVYNCDSGYGSPVRTRLRFNRIGRSHQYGVLRNDAPGIELMGNVWDETSEPCAMLGE